MHTSTHVARSWDAQDEERTRGKSGRAALIVFWPPVFLGVREIAERVCECICMFAARARLIQRAGSIGRY